MSQSMRILKNTAILIIAIFAVQDLSAQNRAPNIGYIYPAGARAGTTVSAVVGGMNFQNIKGARVSGVGIAVESVKFNNPLSRLSNDLKNELRPIIEALEKGKDPIAASKESAEKILKKLKNQAEKDGEGKKDEADRKGGKNATAPDYDEMLKIVPGERLIYIDKTPEEVVEIIKELSPLEYQCLCKEVLTPPNALQTSPAIEQKAVLQLKIDADAQPGLREIRLYSQNGASNPLYFIVDSIPETADDYFIPEHKRTAGRIEGFPRIMNGEIMPGEIDKLKFHAKAGEKYLFSLKARALIPYLGDAVPGWFQPVISVHDKNLEMLAYCDDNYFDPDPVLVFSPPADGEYEIWIRDSIYRGREDFVYRLKAEKIQDTPENEFKKTQPGKELNVVGEREDNNSSQNAQKVILPVLLEGSMDNKKDIDYFLVELGKGEKLAVEVSARRLGSPTDSVIQIYDGDSRILQWNDDAKSINYGLQTHFSDSYCLFEAPESGRYFIKISDAQSKGGEEFKYELRMTPPRPDFVACMTPSALNTAGGFPAPFKVKISRQDGFEGPVKIMVKTGPDGLKVDGNEIPTGTDEVMMTLLVPSGTKEGFHEIKLSAVANFAGGAIERDVVATDEVMQAFIYMHFLPAMETLLFVTRKGGGLPNIKLPKEIAVKAGESKEVFFDCPGYDSKKGSIALELMLPPPGLSLKDGKFEGGKYVFTIHADSKAKAWQGNLIFQLFSEGKKQNKASRWNVGCLPAIPAKIN